MESRRTRKNKRWYIYDEKTDIVFKIKQTRIAGKIYHSYEAMSKGIGSTDGGESEDPNIGDKVPAASSYNKKGNIYVNSPELSYLDVESAYYITYDESGNNPQIAGRIDRIDMPEDWYDYEAKKWANIVTVTNNEVAYWVWIPRYAYKTNSSTQTVDVKFISVTNEYKNGDGQIEELSSDYKIPDSFRFRDETNGYKELAGYWIAKYEVQEAVGEIISADTNISSITVYTTKGETEATYNIFVNGEKKYENVALPYTIKGLKPNTKYDICVANGANILARKPVTTNKIEVSLEGLDPTHTYYVTYDENGENPTIAGRMDKVSQPEDWYNYAEKRWANIITVNGSSVAYWVWIPRYEYITINAANHVDIIYISKEQTEPDPGYKIPDSFRFGDEETGYTELAGFWISKYEVTENPETIGIEPQIGGMTVTASNASSGGIYDVYIDGTLEYSGTLPYTIEGLEQNKKYEVYVLKNGAMLGANEITTKKIEIDMSGLNTEHTYYVVYNEDGTYTLTPLSEGEPENWYNYAEKRWANIVTKNSDETQEAWWVYIPRYEYKIESAGQIVDIKFIPKEQTEADPGYKIPDSFKFGDETNGYTDLAGYWISKYEVSE